MGVHFTSLAGKGLIDRAFRICGLGIEYLEVTVNSWHRVTMLYWRAPDRNSLDGSLVGLITA